MVKNRFEQTGFMCVPSKGDTKSACMPVMSGHKKRGFAGKSAAERRIATSGLDWFPLRCNNFSVPHRDLGRVIPELRRLHCREPAQPCAAPH